MFLGIEPLILSIILEFGHKSFYVTSLMLVNIDRR